MQNLIRNMQYEGIYWKTHKAITIRTGNNYYIVYASRSQNFYFVSNVFEPCSACNCQLVRECLVSYTAKNKGGFFTVL